MMTRKKKASYLQIALALQKVSTEKEFCDRVIQTYEQVIDKEGKFDISDAVDLEFKLDEYHAKMKLKQSFEK